MAGFTYKSYNFIDKDPIIDQVRTVTTGMKYAMIAEASGVTKQTIRNMLDGKTRRPQAATVNAILRACGHKLSIRPIAELETVAPTITMRHVVQIAKYRNLKKQKTKRA
jgi:predicted transcriptional regulator